MSAKHFPDKWREKVKHGWLGGTSISVYSGPYKVCDVAIYEDDPMLGIGNVSDDTLANARLIASAPSMLKALIDIKHRAQCAAGDMGGDVQKIADSAISKAAGATP